MLHLKTLAKSHIKADVKTGTFAPKNRG